MIQRAGCGSASIRGCADSAAAAPSIRTKLPFGSAALPSSSDQVRGPATTSIRTLRDCAPVASSTCSAA